MKRQDAKDAKKRKLNGKGPRFGSNATLSIPTADFRFSWRLGVLAVRFSSERP